ncbi:MAG: outer membrane beta-barrel protein [Flavipsychrobacter sp.]|nr:outer membrane beta-barrel protein [Flavipsychrobacter sp.]
MNRLLNTIILLLGSWVASAQSNYYVEDPRLFRGMVSAGGNFTQIDGDNYAGYSKAGINAGAGVYTMFSNEIGAGLEMLYTRKGSRSNVVKASSNQSFSIISYKAILNYVDLPIQLYYFDARGDHFGAGFSYSRLINQSEVFDTDPPQNLKSEDYPFRKSDYCMVLSANVKIAGKFYVTGRFQYSLVSVRGTTPPGFGRTEQYNNVVTFRLMYLFN